MPDIRDVIGYKTSVDYGLLYEVAHDQSIVCLVIYKGCQEVAHTVYSGVSGGVFVLARGHRYIDPQFRKDEFIRCCIELKLEWIIPERTADEVTCDSRCDCEPLQNENSRLREENGIIKEQIDFLQKALSKIKSIKNHGFFLRKALPVVVSRNKIANQRIELLRMNDANNALRSIIKASYKPKRLVWVEDYYNSRATSMFGTYRISQFAGDFRVMDATGAIITYKSLQDAKDACQLDYDTRWIHGGSPAMEDDE